MLLFSWFCLVPALELSFTKASRKTKNSSGKLPSLRRFFSGTPVDFCLPGSTAGEAFFIALCFSAGALLVKCAPGWYNAAQECEKKNHIIPRSCGSFDIPGLSVPCLFPGGAAYGVHRLVPNRRSFFHDKPEIIILHRLICVGVAFVHQP